MKEIENLIKKWKKTYKKKVLSEAPYEELWCICQIVSDLNELVITLTNNTKAKVKGKDKE